jgi:hypothetical protein
MARDGQFGSSSLVDQVETRVRDLTHGRIRSLVVEERDGRIFVSGQVPSRHIKQLAFHGVLEMISGERFSEEITTR